MYEVNPELARKVFVEGFASLASTAALTALRDACDADSDKLKQGSTTVPPPLLCVQDWPCEATCAVGYLGWAEDGLDATVGQVEERFAVACFRTDEILGEPAACRHLLNFFDGTPRAEALSSISAWCGEVLASRKAEPVPQPVLSADFDPFA